MLRYIGTLLTTNAMRRQQEICNPFNSTNRTVACTCGVLAFVKLWLSYILTVRCEHKRYLWAVWRRSAWPSGALILSGALEETTG